MPWKKSKSPAWKKKGASKKKAWKKSRTYKTVSLARSLNPIPQRMIVKHKYATSVASSLSGLPFAVYQFNLNSMYDPDRTGVGHQPHGRDTYAQLYNKYRVISTSYRVAAIPSNAARVTQVAVLPTNSSPPVLDMAGARESPRCKYIIQQPGAPQQFVQGKVYIPSLMGRTKTQYMSDDTYAAQSSVSPSELAILNVFAGSITDEVISGETMYFNVELEFLVEWYDVIPLDHS